jgi:organic radical activating enzyme
MTLQHLITKYKVATPFLRRYFRQNAENKYLITQLEFMLWRRGQFIKPYEKVNNLDKFIAEEIENFYEKNELAIPRLQFVVTTRCTLKCRDCNGLIPEFRENKNSHLDLTFKEFKQDFDVIMNTVKYIRRFLLLGGEPLLNRDFTKIIDYTARHSGIKVIEIVTNGTLLPSRQLLDVTRKYSDKIYFHLSNYSKNIKIRNILKYDSFISILKKYNIKYQMSNDLVWNREASLKQREYTLDKLKTMFNSCYLKGCTQILSGRLSLCPRLSAGYELGQVEIFADESINLRNSNEVIIRDKIINFYKKEYFEACRSCIRLEEQVMPAIQIGGTIIV